jgi:hypothetical protein
MDGDQRYLQNLGTARLQHGSQQVTLTSFRDSNCHIDQRPAHEMTSAVW